MGGDLLIYRDRMRLSAPSWRACSTFALALVMFAAVAADTRADESTSNLTQPSATMVEESEYGISGGQSDISDPLEPFNRAIFAVNDAIDIVVFRPVAITYRTVLPPPVRSGLANFLANASSPITLANDILQGDAKRAETTMVRFFLNTVAGFGGIDDVAGRAGWERHYEDFGQTLAVWGVPSGPYIVAPLLGPSTPRHLVGRAVDVLANPWTWILWNESTIASLSPTIAETVSGREEALDVLDSVRESSPDYYTTLRNLYWQNRVSEINNGEIIEDELADIPDIR
jgi:phospholipid-binding lipoprotein MlaA